MADIKVYGADWCSMTRRTRVHLDRRHIPYEYVDIDEDRSAASWVAAQNGGKEKKPTVDVAGYVLSEPSNEELDRVLREKGFGLQKS
jgi:glutaredoxin